MSCPIHDKDKLKRLVLDAIKHQITTMAAESNVDGAPPDILAIASALNNGHQLGLEILTGGLANYSYKVTCTDRSNTSPLFAKLSFTYTLIFGPDKPCPIGRTQCEFDALQMYNQTVQPNSTHRASNTAITPYFCINIETDKKLLVTQFSPLEEQFANQFIDGVVDIRVAASLAHSLAALHSMKEYDVNHNIDMVPFIQDLCTIMEEIYDGFIKADDGSSVDRPTQYAKTLGKDTLDNIIQHYRNTMNDKDCIIHGDAHVFNMLVASKPSIESLENFAECGDVVLIDWEFARCGPIAIDVGYVYPFPLACVLTHAMNGDMHLCENILKFLDLLWDEYSNTVSVPVVDERQLSEIYKSMMFFCGVILIAYYKLGFHLEFLPLDEANEEGLGRVKESMGVLGLKFMSWGIQSSDGGEDLSTLRQRYKDAIAEEMQLLSPTKEPRGRSRRSSMLRASGRRVSDAHYIMGGSMRDMQTLLEAEYLMMEEEDEEEE